MKKSTSKIALALLILSVAATTSLHAQKINVTLKDRGFVQQRFSNDFVQKRDSLYLAQHSTCEPFASSMAIDSFMNQFESSWKASITTSDSNIQRIDSYVYGLIERSKRGGDWSESYVWKKYMIPSFLSDFVFCHSEPTAEKASFMWPGNAGNIFAYAIDHEASEEEWIQLSRTYAQMAALLDTYISFKTELDSNQVKSLISTKRYVASLKTFYDASDTLWLDRLDESFVILATGFSEPTNPVKYLSRPVRKLAFQYVKAGKVDRALAILDIAVRSTIDADLARDSLRAWYSAVDPRNGLARLEKILSAVNSPILISTGTHIQLSGRYIDFTTDKPFDLSNTTGKILLIDFWGTFCKPCVDEIPALNAFAKRFSDRTDFVFVSVSCDGAEGGASESIVREFAKKKGINYIVIYDKSDSSLTKKFSVSEWPSKYVINPSGEILQRPGKGVKIDIKTVEEYLARKQ